MVLLGIVPAFLSARNITDLAVMNDKSADASAYQDSISTVDNSVFPHPDRIRFDNRCIPKSVNERFRRFCGLAGLLKEHGTKIARSVLTPVEYTTTDADVKLALRQATNDDRYYSKNIWFPYHLRLNHTGNGFIYLNGHCIGRCWQKGPQTVFYLPECWLNFGGENHLAVSLRSTVDGAEIRKAEIVPVTHAAESLKF